MSLSRKICWVALIALSSLQVHADPEDPEKIKCADELRSPDDPRWVDLVAAVENLDFTKPGFGERDLQGLNSDTLNQAVQSRLKAVKSLYQEADSIESARLMLAYFDDLNGLPERITKPERVDGEELMFYLSAAKSDVRNLARHAFALSVLSLANRHPFLILNDVRVVPVLVAAVFSYSHEFTRHLSPLLPNQKQYLKSRTHIFAQTGKETEKLLGGSRLRLAALRGDAVQVWRQELGIVCGWAGIDERNIIAFAKRLGFDFECPPPSRSSGLTSM